MSPPVELPPLVTAALAASAHPNGHGQDGSGPAAQSPAPDRALAFQTLADLCAEVDAEGPRRWLVRGIWPAGAYGVHAAEPKAGKTWNALDLAVSVTSGTPWLGAHPVDTPGPVVVFAGEGGRGNLVRRLRAVAAARRLRAADLPITVCVRAPHLADEDHLRSMADHLEAIRPVLVILDPLYLAASGANGADLYAMGRLLERPQHIADRVGASLLVVTHYNRARDLRGAARITGAGPAEWGRVLISTQVVSRQTDPDTRESTVIVELDVQGGEVPDQTIRVRRTVRAVDPDDLDSPLVYRTDEPGGAPEDHPQVPGLPPATAKVLAALEAQPDHVPADVQAIGDWIAQKYGGGLKRPTISKALTELSDRGLVDHVEHPRTGRKDWFRVTAGAS